MKTIYTILIVATSYCTLSGQSTFADFLKLFPEAELPYSPPEDYPDFDPDFPEESKPKAFSAEKIPYDMIKEFLDPYAEDNPLGNYPVHQLNFGKYIGLVVYSYQFNRSDGTFMPFYYLYMINKDGKRIETTVELSTVYHRQSMSSTSETYEWTKLNSVIHLNEYDSTKLIIKSTATFTQKRSGEYGERITEESDYFYLLGTDGKWEYVTVRIEE